MTFKEACPLTYSLSLIGQKWKIPILYYLALHGTLRYSKLKRMNKGVTNIMLTKALRELESEDIIIRKVYDTVPPKVEYSIAPCGEALIPTLRELEKWGTAQLQKKKNNKKIDAQI